MPIRRPSRLALVLLLAAAPAHAQEARLTTGAWLEQPELFQIATLSGAMAILRGIPEAAAAPGDAACFAHWTVDEDVLAILAEHARDNPLSLHDPFGATLVAALRARCREAR